MIVSRRPQPRRRKRGGLRFLFAFATTTAMIATGGFGAFPDNPLTQSFREVLSENIPADFLQPFNSYVENFSVPTIQPQVASNPTPPLDLVGFFINTSSPDTAVISTLPVNDVGTLIANFSASLTMSAGQTSVAAATLTSPVTLSPSTTPLITLTSIPSVTSVPTTVPTETLAWVYASPTNTPNPVDSSTPKPTNTLTFTPTNTATSTSTITNTPTSTPTATPIPAGFTLTNISLNTLTNGGAIFTFPGSTFTVSYNYQVWAQSNCSGCVIQLVTGMGSAGVGTSSCIYDGQPGVSPGASGSGSVTITAPSASGTYDVIVQLIAQTNCASAIPAYNGNSGIYKKIGEVVVNNFVVVAFDGGMHNGNLGGRAGADNICVAAKPGAIGNTNVHALISVSTSDMVSNMSANLGVNSNIPVVFQGKELIAKDWTDMLDGSINAALTLSGVSSGSWWTGSESDAGNVIATTATCNGFTDASSSAYGNVGNTSSSGFGWLGLATSQSCSNSYQLICVAGP